MKLNKKLLKIFLLILTLIVFVIYYFHNQDSFNRVSGLSLIQILLILLGQSLVLLANIIILSLIVAFFNKKIALSDSTRVTAYSSLINFFGFLQGGVGFRGIYLKKYFEIPYSKYFLLTFVQYILLFALAGFMVFLGVSFTTSLWGALLMSILGLLILIFIGLVVKRSSAIFIGQLKKRLAGIKFIFHSNKIFLMVCALVLQLTGSFLAYGVALDAIGANLTLGGLLIFTGVSQFSIVIALTPGAIGIREGLLLLVQNQMLLTTEDIVLASTIDRAVYFVTLALLVPIGLNARSKIKIR